MTLSKLRYRLMIEGCDTEWVTDPSLAGTDDQGRTRRIGLQYDGLAIDEKLNLREATVDVSGITATIRSRYANEVFGKQAHALGIAVDDVAYTADAVDVASIGGFSQDQVCHIATEAVQVTSSGGNTLYLRRQYYDTQSQSHYRLIGDRAETVLLHDKPFSLEGRRAYLFRYDETEWPDGDPLFLFGSQMGHARKLKCNTSDATHMIYQTVSDFIPGQLTEFRCFAKDDELIAEQLRVSIGTDYYWARYNTYTGTVTSTSDNLVGSSITEIGSSGWYLLRMWFVPKAASGTALIYALSAAGEEEFATTNGYGVLLYAPKIVQRGLGTPDNLLQYRYSLDSWSKWNCSIESTGTPPGDHTGQYQWTTDTLIWRGLIMSPPRFAVSPSDGPSWSITINPITAVLEQDMAILADKPVGIRGIHHPYSDAMVIYAYDKDGDQSTTQRVSGFWEREQDFLDDVNSALETIRTWCTNEPSVLQLRVINDPANPGRVEYWLFMKTAVTPTQLYLRVVSSLECVLSTHYWQGPSGEENYVDVSGSTSYYATEANTNDKTLSPRIHFRLQNGDRIRGRLRAPEVSSDYWRAAMTDTANAATYPNGRIYYDGSTLSGLVAVGDVCIVSYADVNWEGGTATGTESRHEVTAVDADYVELAMQSLFHVDATPMSSSTQLTFIRMLAAGNVKDLVDEIVERSPYANSGDMPFITAADITFDGLSDYLDTIGLNIREWKFGQSVGVQDVLKEELKLLGAYVHLGSDGRVTAQALGDLAATDPDAIAIGDANIVTPYDSYGAYPSVEPNADGLVNEIELKTGYSSKEDAYNGPTLLYRHVQSISTHKNKGRGQMTIEPKSEAMADEILEQRMYRVLDYFATDHDVITLTVAITSPVTQADGTTGALMDTVFCGSHVRITSAHIPNILTGELGVTALDGLVIGRTFPLDPKEKGIGKLVIRCNRTESARNAGYAPSAYISDIAFVTGLTYDLTVTQNKYAPDGFNDSSFFAVGDHVRGLAFDYSSAYDGTVVAISSATVIRVTFATTPTWIITDTRGLLVFDDDDGNLATNQTDYVYVANTSMELVDESQARRFR